MGKPSGNKRKPRTYEDVIQQIKDRGYIIKAEGGHQAVKRPNGSLLFKFPSTPGKTRSARQTWMSFEKAVKENG